MKKIEKTAASYIYECEKCNTKYDPENYKDEVQIPETLKDEAEIAKFKDEQADILAEKAASNCEQMHVNPRNISGVTYKKDMTTPDTVEITMENDDTTVYLTEKNFPSTVDTGTTNAEGKCSLALVDSYQIEVVKDDDEKHASEYLKNVKLEVKENVLYVTIPEDVTITDSKEICVKVFKGEEEVDIKDIKWFSRIEITAEITQKFNVDSCVEDESNE